LVAVFLNAFLGKASEGVSLAGDGLEGGVYNDGTPADVFEREAGHCPEDFAILLDPGEVTVAFLSRQSGIWLRSVLIHQGASRNRGSFRLETPRTKNSRPLA
jgi:hypothetical protein